jgi:hypothetical protein
MRPKRKKAKEEVRREVKWERNKEEKDREESRKKEGKWQRKAKEKRRDITRTEGRGNEYA